MPPKLQNGSSTLLYQRLACRSWICLQILFSSFTVPCYPKKIKSPCWFACHFTYVATLLCQLVALQAFLLLSGVSTELCRLYCVTSFRGCLGLDYDFATHKCYIFGRGAHICLTTGILRRENPTVVNIRFCEYTTQYTVLKGHWSSLGPECIQISTTCIYKM